LLTLHELTLNLKSSCLCLPNNWDHRCMASHPASSVIELTWFLFSR
jgi:hypothetical protein